MEHVERARRAGLVSLERTLQRQRDRCKCRLVKDAFDTGQCLANGADVANVPFHKLNPVGNFFKVFPIACAKIVDHPDFVTGIQQPTYNM